MRSTALLTLAITLPSIALGQSRSKAKVEVLTVCEVLGNVDRYADTAVAVVGRMESSVSPTDHYEFLSQDRCERPVITHGHTWSSRIEIWTDWEPGEPKPPVDQPVLKPSIIANKLKAVQSTTRLGSHEEPQFDKYGRFHRVDVPNEWAIVYGRIGRNPRLNMDCGTRGCGGDDVPLLIVAEESQVRTLTTDGRLGPEAN